MFQLKKKKRKITSRFLTEPLNPFSRKPKTAHCQSLIGCVFLTRRRVQPLRGRWGGLNTSSPALCLSRDEEGPGHAAPVPSPGNLQQQDVIHRDQKTPHHVSTNNYRNDKSMWNFIGVKKKLFPCINPKCKYLPSGVPTHGPSEPQSSQLQRSWEPSNPFSLSS